MSTPEELESEADYERALAAAPDLITALVDLECDDCGLNIHAGEPTVLGARGWVHPVCGELEQYAADVQAEFMHDMPREREG